VINGITGFIVPKRDAEALANCMAELIANPGLARRLGSAGRERAQALYNAERCISDLMERFRSEPEIAATVTRRCGEVRIVIVH